MSAERITSRRSFLTLAAAGIAATAGAQIAPLEDLTRFPRALVEIATRERVHRFDVRVADTPARQAQGLMFVRDLPADEGMLFVHEKPRPASMWMKNTYIELDMLFVAPDGRIVKIAERARPHSLETIGTDIPVKAVLELRGGEASRRGLSVGDRVTWKHSNQSP